MKELILPEEYKKEQNRDDKILDIQYSRDDSKTC